jgi:hypothetical protein
MGGAVVTPYATESRYNMFAYLLGTYVDTWFHNPLFPERKPFTPCREHWPTHTCIVYNETCIKDYLYRRDAGLQWPLQATPQTT